MSGNEEYANITKQIGMLMNIFTYIPEVEDIEEYD